MIQVIVSYDLEKDITNRYEACNCSGYGVDWKQQIGEDAYKWITGQSKELAYPYIKQTIEQQLMLDINEYQEKLKIDADLQGSASFLCTLEQATGYFIPFKTIKIYITSFPRCPYDPNLGTLMCYYKVHHPIHALLHESLHFIFHSYFSHFLSENILTFNQFHYLKEAQTIILNEIFPGLICELGDYPDHQKLRNSLLQHRTTHHDFKQLVEFGVSEILNQSQ